MRRSKTLMGISLLAGMITLAGCSTQSDPSRSGGATTGSMQQQTDDSSDAPRGKSGGEAGRSGYGASGGSEN